MFGFLNLIIIKQEKQYNLEPNKHNPPPKKKLVTIEMKAYIHQNDC